jgi:RNA polymerase sigma factor (TIGR02999 family)
MGEDAAKACSLPSDVTALLEAARGGDASAAGAVFERLYDELRRIARARLRPHRDHTLLDTTSLVHECYLRVVDADGVSLESRRHFYAYAAKVMRSVIVDFARARQAERRGGGVEHVVIDTRVSESVGAPENDVLRVHEALDSLAQLDARLAQIVEMRYFGGLSEADIASLLDVSERTVRRDWQKARLLLIAALS